MRSLSPAPPTTISRYGTAVVLTLAATGVARLLDPLIAPHFSPPYFLAVMFTAVVAGAGPALLATILCSAAVAFFDLGERGFLLGPDDLVRLAAFAVAAMVIGSVSARRKEAERALRDAVEKLAATDRAKDEFIAAVSHELRTPLTGILGWARILRAEYVDEPTRRAAAESIEQSAAAQAILIDDMLDASRIVLGKLVLSPVPLSLAEVLHEAVAVVHPSATARGVQLQIDPIPDPILLEADRGRLKQVFWNLLSNAVKFTPAGGRVRVSARIDRRRAMVEVSDTGEGIDPMLLPFIFDRFRQGPEGARKGGLGLGLWITRHMVEMHGGSIHAFSEGVSRGAVFRVFLPLPDRRPDSGESARIAPASSGER